MWTRENTRFVRKLTVYGVYGRRDGEHTCYVVLTVNQFSFQLSPPPSPPVSPLPPWGRSSPKCSGTRRCESWCWDWTLREKRPYSISSSWASLSTQFPRSASMWRLSPIKTWNLTCGWVFPFLKIMNKGGNTGVPLHIGIGDWCGMDIGICGTGTYR